jgi:hypothetical protein
MKRTVPKVIFKIAAVDEMMPMIQFFLNPPKGGWDWSPSIFSKYPELKLLLKDVEKVNERKKIALDFFKQLQISDRNLLEKRRKFFEKSWEGINDDVMKTLSEITEQEWPAKDKKMIARLSLSPINPRYIKERTFDVYYKSDTDKMKEIAIHELLHFIYFEKWKSLFPQVKESAFDAPYLTWQLSEMVPEIVLNDKRMQEVLKCRFHSYKEYQKCRIRGKPLLQYLQKFYDERKDFEDFLRKSWQFVKKHIKELNNT